MRYLSFNRVRGQMSHEAWGNFEEWAAVISDDEEVEWSTLHREGDGEVVATYQSGIGVRRNLAGLSGHTGGPSRGPITRGGTMQAKDPNSMTDAELIAEAIAAWHAHEEAQRAAARAAARRGDVERALSRRHYDAKHGRGDPETDFDLATEALYCDGHVIAFAGDGVTVMPAIDVTRAAGMRAEDAPPADPRAWKPVRDEPMF